eukprot:3328669-Rhodomonas_salina.3
MCRQAVDAVSKYFPGFRLDCQQRVGRDAATSCPHHRTAQRPPRSTESCDLTEPTKILANLGGMAAREKGAAPPCQMGRVNGLGGVR